MFKTTGHWTEEEKWDARQISRLEKENVDLKEKAEKLKEENERLRSDVDFWKAVASFAGKF